MSQEQLRRRLVDSVANVHKHSEMARHVGHADTLREQNDGTTGR